MISCILVAIPQKGRTSYKGSSGIFQSCHLQDFYDTQSMQSLKDRPSVWKSGPVRFFGLFLERPEPSLVYKYSGVSKTGLDRFRPVFFSLDRFFIASFLHCLIWCASLLGFTICAFSQNGLTCHECSPVFPMSSSWYCLIWYTSLLAFTIHPIPQNRWTSYEACPSFQCHHSGTALYGMYILSASKFSGYLRRNPSILRHLARVHKYYNDYEGF
jgi:hypothetical protein